MQETRAACCVSCVQSLFRYGCSPCKRLVHVISSHPLQRSSHRLFINIVRSRVAVAMAVAAAACASACVSLRLRLCQLSHRSLLSCFYLSFIFFGRAVRERREAIRDRRDEILTETCTETLSGGRGVMR